MNATETIVAGSALERASFYRVRDVHVIPLNPTTLTPAPGSSAWREKLMTPSEMVAIFQDGRFEVGLGTHDGVIAIECPDPIAGWVHQTFGEPWMLTERFGLRLSLYHFEGEPFENPLQHAQGGAIRVHHQGVVSAPGTPQPGRKLLWVQRSGGTWFHPSWMPHLARESREWRKAYAEATALCADARARGCRGRR